MLNLLANYIPLQGTSSLAGSIVPNTAGVNLGSLSNPYNEVYANFFNGVLSSSTGPTGPAGSASLTGATGYTGYTGYTGPAGPAGSASSTGATGYTGYTGYTGPAGPAGASTSTGATGPTGYTGYTGYTGPAGFSTNTGATGPTGPAGASGNILPGYQVGDVPIWNGTAYQAQDQSLYIGGLSGIASQGTGTVAIGYQAARGGALSSPWVDSVLIGLGAGISNNNPHAFNTQGCIGIGYEALAQGPSTNQQFATAIGYEACSNADAGLYSVALGYQVSAPSNNSIVLNASGGPFTGTAAGFFVSPVRSIPTASSPAYLYIQADGEIVSTTGAQSAIPAGTNWGDYLYWNGSSYAVGDSLITLGAFAGQFNAQTGSVSLGTQAGQGSAGTGSINIGYQAGLTGSGINSINIGTDAASAGSAPSSVNIGNGAGAAGSINLAQATGAVNLGWLAGFGGFAANTICIGELSGTSTGAPGAIAIGQGSFAGGPNSMAIGQAAVAGPQSVALGYASQAVTTGATSLGYNAGVGDEAYFSTAVGYSAGFSGSFGSTSVGAASIASATGAVALGNEALAFGQQSIAIGTVAQATNANSIAIGSYTSSLTGSIAISAGGKTAPLTGTQQGALYVGPIRAISDTGAFSTLYYNAVSSEITAPLTAGVYPAFPNGSVTIFQTTALSAAAPIYSSSFTVLAESVGAGASFQCANFIVSWVAYYDGTAVTTTASSIAGATISSVGADPPNVTFSALHVSSTSAVLQCVINSTLTSPVNTLSWRRITVPCSSATSS